VASCLYRSIQNRSQSLRHNQEVLVKSKEGTVYRRNIAHVKAYREPGSDGSPPEGDIAETGSRVEIGTGDTAPDPDNSDGKQKEQSADVTPADVTPRANITRFGRHSHKPTYLNDYSLK